MKWLRERAPYFAFWIAVLALLLFAFIPRMETQVLIKGGTPESTAVAGFLTETETAALDIEMTAETVVPIIDATAEAAVHEIDAAAETAALENNAAAETVAPKINAKTDAAVHEIDAAAETAAISELDEIVYVTKSGRKYHRADCYTIRDSASVTEISRYDAEAERYEPCKICKP